MKRPLKKHITLFIQASNKELEIEEKVKKATPKSNSSKNGTDSLQQLSQRDDIIIIKADEGGAVVIINVDYIFEANQQLNNIGFYKKIPNHPTESIIQSLYYCIIVQ